MVLIINDRGISGSLTVESNAFSSKGFYSNIQSSNNEEQVISFRIEIVVHGDAEFGESGINLSLNKQSNLPQTKLEGSYVSRIVELFSAASFMHASSSFLRG